ncbi:chitosanase [Chryseobacterium lactis]|uniref:chitosanase n=1 Tax=Chryseobacterium lactis TaxID=1241981 RepID=UPI00162344F8|nr:chitosanase [Chryseobacterium lactis]
MEFKNLPSGISQSAANKIAEVISTFENGKRSGGYDAYVAYRDERFNGSYYRQITYGRFQTTEFGNLKKLIQMYIEANGTYANFFKDYVNDIGKIVGNTPVSLYQNEDFVQALKDAGKNDPIMQTVQEDFFDLRYFQPALSWFKTHGFTLPLSLLVIFDSFIHSGSIKESLRKMFPEYPPNMGGDEKRWITQYTAARHAWLSNYETKEVRASAYRTQTFKDLILNDNWDLTKPFKTQGIQF